ncbi:MAG: MFS transporter, partial [Desulfobacter sp.]
MSTAQTPGPLPRGERIDYKIVLVLSLVHFTGDFYSSFFTPLLPAFQAKLSLTLTQVGLITGAVRFLSFVVQPVVGYMADRYETRWFVLTGLFLVFFVIPFSGIAPNYWILLTTLCLGSVG